MDTARGGCFWLVQDPWRPLTRGLQAMLSTFLNTATPAVMDRHYKLVPCAWFSSDTLEVWRSRLYDEIIDVFLSLIKTFIASLFRPTLLVQAICEPTDRIGS